MTCRDEILECARKVINQKDSNKFTIEDILECMRKQGTKYSNSTIRTHIVSRLCVNAPNHHKVTYQDIERIDRGIYRLREGLSSLSVPEVPQQLKDNHRLISTPKIGSNESVNQKIKKLSNKEKGKLFQTRSQKVLGRAFGCAFQLEVRLPIPPRKSHIFDLVNNEQTIVAECKSLSWTVSGNYPSAKITNLREAIQYLYDLQGEKTRCLIMSKSCHPKRNESLGAYFVRLNQDYLGKVNLYELAEDSDELVCLHGRLGNKDQSTHAQEPSKSTLPEITVNDLGNLRRSIFRILDLAEGQRSREESPAKRVSRLREEGQIPRITANLMHTILGIRNAVEYNECVLTKAEQATINCAWEAIREWAQGNGWQIEDSLAAQR